jgi:hypothetical protein
MPSRLAPCPSCRRHVKVGPTSCAFCGAAVPADVPRRTLNVPRGTPITRAVLSFAGIAAVSACASTEAKPVIVMDATTDTAGEKGGGVPLYGGFGGTLDGGVAEDADLADASADGEADSDIDDGDDMFGGDDAAYGGFASDDADGDD